MPSSNKVVLVTFAPNQWKLVTPFVGTVGIGQADTVRNIVIHWVLEHSNAAGPAPAQTPAPGSKRDRA